MANWIIEQLVDLSRGAPTPRVWPDSLMLCGDNLAHEWCVTLVSQGTPADLIGYSAAGYFRRVDGNTVRVNGTITGNQVKVSFPDTCYAYAGELDGVMQISTGAKRVTIAALVFQVRKTITDAIIDPGSAIPNLEQLLNLIASIESTETERQGQEAARQAAEAARAAYYTGYNDEITRTRLWRNTPALSVAQVTPVPSSPLDATVKVVSTQAGSGDPSPSNIRAITGRNSAKVKRTGKNLFDPSHKVSGMIVNTSSHTISTASGAYSIWCECVEGRTYVLSKSFVTSRMTYGFTAITPETGVATITDAGLSAALLQYSVTAPAGARYLVLYYWYGDTGGQPNLQCEIGSVATVYEAYAGTELTLTPAATLYGVAGAEDEIGVDGHEVHNTVLTTLTGGEAWSMSSSQPSDTTLARFQVSMNTVAMNANGICDTVPYIQGGDTAKENVWQHISATYMNVILLKSRLAGWDDGLTSTEKVALFKAWLASNNMTVVAKRGTPTPAQGTAQTLAALAQADKYTPRLNNVYSDGGNVVVGYAQHPSRTYDFLNEKTGYGVVSGLAVSSQSTPNMTVAVSAGVAYMADGTRYAPLAVSALAINAADATNPRIDIVYLASDGVISYLAGTAAATPAVPTAPSGMVLNEIEVAANATAITSSNIVRRARTMYMEGFVRPTLTNGAQNYDAVASPLEYGRDVAGRVYIRGRVKSISTDASIFTLAVGYRPLRTTLLYLHDAVGKTIVGYITAGGTVVVNASVGYGSYIALDGVYFVPTT